MKTVQCPCIYVCVISDAQDFSFLCPMERNLQMRNQCESMTNLIPVDLMKVIYEKALVIGQLIAHFGNSAP